MKCRIALCAIALSLAGRPAQGQTANVVPWMDDFESYPLGTQLVNGTNGWYGSETNIVVQDQVVRRGSKAAVIPYACMLSNKFHNSGKAQVWLQMDVRPVLYDGEDTPLVDTSASAMFYINSNGYFVAHDGPPTNWIVLDTDADGDPVQPLTSNQWVTVSVYRDYTNRTWSLYSDYILLRSGMGFINTNRGSFSGFGVYNGLGPTSYLDQVSVSFNYILPALIQTPSVLSNGVVYGTNASSQTIALTVSPSEPVYPLQYSISCKENWLGIAPTNGWISYGQTNLISVTYSNQDIPFGPGTYTATVVAATSDGGGSTSRVTVLLTVYPAVTLARSPAILAQTAHRGTSATQQEFNVWNSSLPPTAPMRYWATKIFDQTWYDISHTTAVAVGVSPVTVTYNTAHFDPGVYTSKVTLTANSDVFPYQTAENSPLEVLIRLTVDYPAPFISVSSTTIVQTVVRGHQASNQWFQIYNGSGHYTLNYSISDDSPWLSVSRQTGSSTGEHDYILLSYDTSDLDIGTHTGRITIVGTCMEYGDISPNSPFTMYVLMTVRGPFAPQVIDASNGTYKDRVHISWRASAEAAWYEVWRYHTMDSDWAVKIAEVTGTNYDDYTVQPALRYYYWMKSVNQFGFPGDLSTNDPGWAALSAPASVIASAGAYSDRIRVSWSIPQGAESFQIWRSTGSDVRAASQIAHTTGRTYDDQKVTAGTRYNYWVKALKPDFFSDFAGPATGYAMAPPSAVSASDGSYSDKVRVSWRAADGANSYEVWRAETTSSGVSVKLGESASTSYDDTTAIAGVEYMYRVKARNTTTTSEFSDADLGYRATGLADLSVNDVVFLPGTIGLGRHPAVISYTLENKGSQVMSGSNTRVRQRIYFSTAPTLGAGNDILLAESDTDATLGLGEQKVMTLPQTVVQSITATATGAYWVLINVEHQLPSKLGDPNPANNTAARSGQVTVSAGATPLYHSFNDYNGDGRADLAVYNTLDGSWYIRGLFGELIAWGMPWGGYGFVPVWGDFDGDRVSDMAVYDLMTGRWYARSAIEAKIKMWAIQWGSPGYLPAPGDFDGDGIQDIGVYSSTDGRWYLRNAQGAVLLWGQNWGGPNLISVPGDYDGDGRWDLSVFDLNTGNWYIRTVPGVLVMWAESWGGPTFTPVCGDFDGDGRWDPAVYHEPTGTWYIRTVAGALLLWGQPWGGPGLKPVAGDFDGDSRWDLALYQESSGAWYVCTINGQLLGWGVPWGGPGLLPIGQ